MFRTNKKSTDGFTIIEVVISLAIATLIFLLVTSLYILIQKTYQETDAKAEITQNGRVILDRMVRELRQTPDIITELPATIDASSTPPTEIMFQNGHNTSTDSTSTIEYIRYFLDGTNIERQIIVYYFPSEPTYYVHSYDTDKDPPHNPPIQAIMEQKTVGEYAGNIEFWGSGGLININLYLSRNGQSSIISTAVYGRNL
jgi:type II secretory pathway component PulJ